MLSIDRLQTENTQTNSYTYRNSLRLRSLNDSSTSKRDTQSTGETFNEHYIT